MSGCVWRGVLLLLCVLAGLPPSATDTMSFNVNQYSLSLLTFPSDTWTLGSLPSCGTLNDVKSGSSSSGGICSGCTLAIGNTLSANQIMYDSRGCKTAVATTFSLSGSVPLDVTLNVILTSPQPVTVDWTNSVIEGNTSLFWVNTSVNFVPITTATGCIGCKSYVTKLPLCAPNGCVTDIFGNPITQLGFPLINQTYRYHTNRSVTASDSIGFRTSSSSGRVGNMGTDALNSIHINQPPVLVTNVTVVFIENPVGAENTFNPKDPSLILANDGPNPLTYRLVMLPTVIYNGKQTSDPSVAGVLYQSIFFGEKAGMIGNAYTSIYNELIFVPPSNRFNYTGWFQFTVADKANPPLSSKPLTVYFSVIKKNEVPFVTGILSFVTQNHFVYFTVLNGVFGQPGDEFIVKIDTPPSKGALYQVGSNMTKGPRITSSAFITNPEGYLLYYPNVGDPPQENYVSFLYSASNAENPSVFSPSSSISIDIIAVTRPVALPLNFTGDEDAPVVITLSGISYEGFNLTGVVNTLPVKGTLYQYNESDPLLRGDPIAKPNGSQFFNMTFVTDPQNRIVFFGEQYQFGVDYTLFTFVMYNGYLLSNIGTVTISLNSVINPVTATNLIYSIQELTTLVIQLTGFNPDPGSGLDVMGYRLLNTTTNSSLFQTDGTLQPKKLVKPPFPCEVTDPGPSGYRSGGRVVYVAPEVPVLQVHTEVFGYYVYIPPVADRNYTLYSNNATVTINVIGINHVPLAYSQSIKLEENNYTTITLAGSDLDPTDQNQLTAVISQLPTKGKVAQYTPPDDTGYIQFDFINTAPENVLDSLNRVYYIPTKYGWGDPYDSFQFQFYDQKDYSVPADVWLSVSCINNPPNTDGIPSTLSAESGSDIVITLGGGDVDLDNRGLTCNGSGTLYAVIDNPPALPSKLYQYVSNELRGMALQTIRGPQITENGTIVTDPQRRVVLDAEYDPNTSYERYSLAQFNVHFFDGWLNSTSVIIKTEVRKLSGVLPSSYGQSWRLIVAIIAAVALALCVLFILGLMIQSFNEKKRIPGIVEDWDIADAVIDEGGEEGDFDFFEMEEKPKGPLENLLVNERLEVVSALCEIVEVTDFEELAAALVAVFEFHGQTMHLIRFLITKEVREAASAGTLFRSNSMASKVMSAYSKKIGQDYLIGVLRTPILHICTKDISMEVDPRKVAPGEDRKENMKRLLLACSNFVDWIVTSGGNAPYPFRQICQHLYHEVNKRFPQSRHSAIGGFLFLRFFCPAIISPEGYGVVDDIPSVRSRRSLVLIAKALQNLANGVPFGNKEAYMIDVNAFIESNQDRIIQFFEEMNEAGAPRKVRPADVDPLELEEGLNSIHRHLYIHRDEVGEVLIGGGEAARSNYSTRSHVDRDMTDGLTTFLHTHSLGDATNLNTSDLSGMTIRTQRAGRSIREVTRRGTSNRTHDRSENATEWDFGMDATDHMATTMGGSDSDGFEVTPFLLEAEEVAAVPFENEDMSDFDLSSTLPTDTSLMTNLTSRRSSGGTYSNRRSTYNSSRKSSDRSRRGTEATDNTHGSKESKGKADHQRSFAGRKFSTARTHSHVGDGTEQLLDAGGDAKTEVDGDDWGEEEGVDLYDPTMVGVVAVEFHKVMDLLGPPPN